MRSLLERETIISYNQLEKTGNVYTFDPKVIARLDEAAKERPDECKFLKDGPEGAKEYEVPKTWLRPRPTRKLNYTEEERAEMSERMKKIREQRHEK